MSRRRKDSYSYSHSYSSAPPKRPQFSACLNAHSSANPRAISRAQALSFKLCWPLAPAIFDSLARTCVQRWKIGSTVRGMFRIKQAMAVPYSTLLKSNQPCFARCSGRMTRLSRVYHGFHSLPPRCQKAWTE
jgi:hypothetical protein